MLHFQSTLSDNALYLYQVSHWVSKQIMTDERTYGRKTGSLYCAMPYAGATKMFKQAPPAPTASAVGLVLLPSKL